jgi:hypothetical protein
MRFLSIALLLPFLNANPLQQFVTEFWTLYGAKDAYIRPLDPKDSSNPCPRGGLHRAETLDCIRWFSPGCGEEGGIVNITTMRCRRRTSPIWHPNIYTTDPTLGTQICMAAGAGSSSRLVLNATFAVERKTHALKCIGPRQDDITIAASQSNKPHILSASIGGSFGALFTILLLVGVLTNVRRKNSNQSMNASRGISRQSPIQVTRTSLYESSLTFYNLQSRSSSSVAIPISEQRSTFRPTPSRKHRYT